jgi:lysine 6-dehydrogenase
MKALVLGAGMIGKAIAYDLNRNTETILADIERQHVEMIAQQLGCEGVVCDVTDKEALFNLMTDCDVTVSAVPYFLNYDLAHTALKAGCHFCDLGGNYDIVNQELSLHKEAVRENVLIIPDCGVAPGMSNIIAAHGIEEVDGTKVYIRVGGLPQNPKPPLHYALVFSVHGLISEYVEPAIVIRNGKIREVEPLTEIEEIDFPPVGILEAFLTAAGTSTLPYTYKGKLKELDEKTIRYKGHCAIMRTLLEMGMFSEEPVHSGSCSITPRAVLSEVLERILPHEDRDMVLLRVTVKGDSEEKIYEMIDYFDEDLQMTAMARTTAYPASIVAQMMGRGTISKRGVLPPEQAVPGNEFMKELERRKISIRKKRT